MTSNFLGAMFGASGIENGLRGVHDDNDTTAVFLWVNFGFDSVLAFGIGRR